MDLIARLCDPVIVMAEGTVLTRGSMADIRANEEVIEAYLGGGKVSRGTDGAPAADAASGDAGGGGATPA